jgi:general secretion pathway protein D
MTGILGLQSIPVLNKIFTSRTKNNEENEILISITPHILRSPKVVDEDLAGLLVGTEEIPRIEGARPPLFGPAEPAAPPPAEPLPLAPPPGAVRPLAPPGPGAGAAMVAPPVAPLPVGEDPTVAPAPARLLTAQLSPPDAVVAVGETIAVSVLVMGVRDATTVEALLNLGPGLELVEAQAGSLLTFDGSAVGAERVVEGGRIRVRFTRPTGATGSGALVTLRVRGAQPGSTSVVLESLQLGTVSGVERASAAAASRIQVN